MKAGFPFSAVVGLEEAKLALLLNAVDPRVGGVLLRGQKGSAKSTLARGLASLLPGQAPFVELPVGATEDRLVGSIDVTAALRDGDVRFMPGLLSAADGGVLYVDEVNLLPDHLVDVLLDVAAGGVNRVEREGVSHEHAARFVLVGSMNPEEGELRPQLLDRFGLACDVIADTDPDERSEAVARRVAFDGDPDGCLARWERREGELRARLVAARPAEVSPELLREISRVCASVGAEGLRADLTICRAAAALAGWEGRADASLDDVRRVAQMALAHRRRRSPFDDPGISADELDEAFGGSPPIVRGDSPNGHPESGVPAEPDAPTRVVRLDAGGGTRTGRRSLSSGPRGRVVGDGPWSGDAPVAVGATARAVAARGGGVVEAADLREAKRQQRVGNLVILAVDASGSMGAERRMEAAKGAVLSLLLDAYQRRDRVALVTFRRDGAEVVLRPTSSVEVARARLAELPTGGRTPLAAGIRAALDLVDSARADSARADSAGADGDAHRPLLVLVSDGRATAAPNDDDPVLAAHAAAAAVRRRGISAVVVDAEDGPARLGLARPLADAMGARYLTVPALSAGALDHVMRSFVP